LESWAEKGPVAGRSSLASGQPVQGAGIENMRVAWVYTVLRRKEGKVISAPYHAAVPALPGGAVEEKEVAAKEWLTMQDSDVAYTPTQHALRQSVGWNWRDRDSKSHAAVVRLTPSRLLAGWRANRKDNATYNAQVMSALSRTLSRSSGIPPVSKMSR